MKSLLIPEEVMMTSSGENISALLALSAGNSPVTGGFSSQRPVMRCPREPNALA